MKCSSAAANKMQGDIRRPAGRKRQGKSKTYSRFIYRVIKQGPQEHGVCLSRESDLIMSIAAEAARLSLYKMRRIITRREVESAVKNITPSGRSTGLLPGSAATD